MYMYLYIHTHINPHIYTYVYKQNLRNLISDVKFEIWGQII